MFPALRHWYPPKKFALLITLVAVSACSLSTDLSGPAAIVQVSGDQQTAPTNTPLAAPLAVIVVTQFGERLRNVTVTWSIVSGGGTLSATSTQTDDGGIAEVNYTTGATAGQVVIHARVQGLPPLAFNITTT